MKIRLLDGRLFRDGGETDGVAVISESVARTCGRVKIYWAKGSRIWVHRMSFIELSALYPMSAPRGRIVLRR